MKGIVKYARGMGHIEVRDVPEPTPPPEHLIIEVAAAGICGTDIHIYHDEYGYTPPVVLGHETAGTVVEAGQDVTRFRVGDRVTTEPYFHTCGVCVACRSGSANLCPERRAIGVHVNGAMARYTCVPERICYRLPDNVSSLDASITEPLACTVNSIIIRGGVKAGDVVVISGPGAIGQFCAQVAKACGATTIVVGVTGDERRLVLAGELGADHTVRADKGGLAELVSDLTNGRGADVTIEASGAQPSLTACVDLVRKGGAVLQIGLYGKPVTIEADKVALKELRYSGSFASVPAAWPISLRLLADGMVRSRPLITRQVEVEDWQEAFDAFNARTECKIVVVPVA